MKKIITIVAIVLALSSCTYKKVTHDEWQSQHDRECASRITKFNYEGHSYLLYERNLGNASTAGITHDANCQCRDEFCDD